jgi:hypothetical protein
MQLARVQEDERGWELHLYECDKCNSQETYIVKKVGVRDCEHDAGRASGQSKKAPVAGGARGASSSAHIWAGPSRSTHPYATLARCGEASGASIRPAP